MEKVNGPADFNAPIFREASPVGAVEALVTRHTIVYVPERSGGAESKDRPRQEGGLPQREPCQGRATGDADASMNERMRSLDSGRPGERMRVHALGMGVNSKQFVQKMADVLPGERLRQIFRRAKFESFGVASIVDVARHDDAGRVGHKALQEFHDDAAFERSRSLLDNNEIEEFPFDEPDGIGVEAAASDVETLRLQKHSVIGQVASIFVNDERSTLDRFQSKLAFQFSDSGCHGTPPRVNLRAKES